MRYISPIRHLNIDTNHVDATGNMPKSVLNLAKKRLLAEIDLSPKQTIWQGQTEMSKNDVLKWFDQLAVSGELGFHILIAQDPVLLTFLEQQHLAAGAHFKADLYQDSKFIAFVSPYYQTSFNKVLIDALEKQDEPVVNTLLHYNPILMTGYQSEAAWLKINRYLNDKLEVLQGIIKQNKYDKKYSYIQAKRFYEIDLLLIFNHLPDSFQKFRDDYCIALINLSGFGWNGAKYDFVEKVILASKILECSPNIRRILQTRIEWYEIHLPAIRRSTLTWKQKSVIVFAIVMILLYLYGSIALKSSLYKLFTL
jgi:hypothetical protein